MSETAALEPFASALVAALGFGVAGSALLAAAVWLWIRALEPSATTRHALWWIALVASVVFPVVCLATSLTRIEHRPAVRAYTNLPVSSGTRSNASLAKARLTTASLRSRRLVSGRKRRSSVKASAEMQTPLGEALRAVAFVSGAPFFDLAVVVLWLVVMAGRAATLLRRLTALHAVKAGAPALDETIVRRLRRWRHSCRTARRVVLRVSAAVDVPVAVGFRRPAILLPVRVACDESAADLDQIALHEHAHLNRYDDWTNLAERAIACALWFNPVVSFLLRRISLEREIACDDRVVAQTGRAHRYATCLWRLVRTSRLPAAAILAPGALFTSKQITTRIERLLDSRRNALPRLSPFAAIFIALVGIAAVILQAQRAPAIAVSDPQPSSSHLSRVPRRAVRHVDADRTVNDALRRANVDRTVHDALRRANVDRTFSDALHHADVDRTVHDALRRASVARTVSDALRRANADRTVRDALHRANVDRSVSDALRRANVDHTVRHALRRANVARTVSDALRLANVDHTVSEALHRAGVNRTVSDAPDHAGSDPAAATLSAEVDQAVGRALAQANVATRIDGKTVHAHLAQAVHVAPSNAAGATPANDANLTGETALVRNLPRFRRIVLDTGIRIEVRRSARSRIDFGGAVQEARHTTADVNGDTLTIGGRGSWTDEEPNALITIETPSLDSVDVDGSSSVVIDDVRANRLTLTMNGSGSIVVARGFAASATVEDSGSGTIELVHLRTTTLSASVEGSGDVTLSAPRELTLEIDGSGSIDVHGHAQALTSQINGSGHIIQE
ncbi:MAG: DUF2807 domain-containing protein [Candidatus Eremiobacteraeota bacterium]|nr:DUF2807 domain-containing protein [Candidatus Eremiobacteraeota bacterium]